MKLVSSITKRRDILNCSELRLVDLAPGWRDGSYIEESVGQKNQGMPTGREAHRKKKMMMVPWYESIFYTRQYRSDHVTD